MITEIFNEAEVQGEVLHVRAELKIDLLGKGWIEVPLRLSDAALLSARIGDQPALIVADEEHGHRLLWNKADLEPAQIELTLEYARRITKAPAENSVEFQAPLAPVNRWRIRIPEAGVKVNVHPLLAATEAPAGSEERPDEEESGDGSESDPAGDPGEQTVVLAFVGAAPTVRIDWTPKAEGATGMEALVSVQADQEVLIDEGVTRTRIALNYEISRAELEELQVELPADQRVVNVTDANLRQWNVETDGARQIITVGLFEPVRNQQGLRIELEKFRQDDESIVSVPSIQASGVARQRGLVLVRLAEVLRGETIRRSGLSQVAREEIPEPVRQQTWDYSFRYASVPFDLAFQIEEVEPRIYVDHLVEAYLEPQSLTVELFAKYDIQRAGVFELQLDLPPGFEVQQVRGQEAAGVQAAVVDTHTVDNSDPARPQLRINLSAKAQGLIGLRVDLLRRLDDANLLSPTGQSSQIELRPPRAVGPRIVRSTGRIVLYAPESLRVGIEQLDGLRNISFEEAFQDTASLREERFPELRPVQAMSFSDAAAIAGLTVQRRQPYVTARQLLEVRIEPGVAKYTATFFYNIRYSSVKSLRIDLPSAIAGQVRNQTKSLRESALEESDGYVGWILVGESELLSDVQVQLTWESPIEDLGIGKSVDLTLPRLIPRDVDRADGQIVLVKSETIDVQPKGIPEGLDPIDPEHDLISGVQIPNAATAFEFQDDWGLTLTATRYQLQMLKQTSIDHALLRLVVTRSDRIAVQALYRLRSNRQRLRVELPDEIAEGKLALDTDPLRINGRRVALERGEDDRSCFIPLVGINANEPFLLELRYTTAGGARSLEYPFFPDEPATQRVDLVAYIPQERSYLGMSGPWTDEQTWVRETLGNFRVHQPRPRIPVEQLLENLTRGINLTGNPGEDFPIDGRPLLFSTLRPPAPDVGALKITTLSTRWLHALVFGTVAVLGLLLVWRPFSDRIVAICTFVVVLLLLGVFLPTFARTILNEILLLAVALVLLVWLAAFAIQSLRRLGTLQIQWPRRPPRAESSEPTAGEPVASTASSEDAEARPAGGSNDAS